MYAYVYVRIGYRYWSSCKDYTAHMKYEIYYHPW